MEKFICLYMEQFKSSFPQVEPDGIGNPLAEIIEARDWEEALEISKRFQIELEKQTAGTFRLIQISIGS